MSCASPNESPPSAWKACKTNRFNVKLFFKDKGNCWITGIAITEDGTILMVDFYNKKLKIFNKDLENLSHLVLSGEIRDVAVISNQQAVVTMGCEQKLHILDIRDNKPVIQETIQLKFDVMGVTVCKGNFVVTCPNTVPPSVKMIHRNGKVIWSTSADQSSHSFADPWYVCSDSDGTRIALTDRESHTVIVIDADTGKVIDTKKLEGKHPRGVCMDPSGGVFICYQNGVGLLTDGLTKESVLISSETGLDSLPEAIAYDSLNHRLFTSYSPLHKHCNSLDCFQLK